MLTSPLCTHKYPHWIVEYSKPVSNVTGNNGLMSLAPTNEESGVAHGSKKTFVGKKDFV